MKSMKESVAVLMKEAFVKCGFEERFGEVSLSNRPDICDYQCNSAMQLAKILGKAPIEIAKQIAEGFVGHEAIVVEAVMPGFINITIKKESLAGRLNEMSKEDKLGYEPVEPSKTIIIDYGGANVAKSLHVGHLRSAVIGESLKRIHKFGGHKVIGDIHLGDWGLQMGYVIEELRISNPELPYYDACDHDAYPVEAPFDIEGLTKLYTEANIRSKSDESFKEAARITTAELQQGKPGYVSLWKHILNISAEDLKKNYHNLNVDFDLWYGESDSQPYIPNVIEALEAKGILEESQGAKVVFVEEETDKKPLPPCIILKENGAVLYATTDLATIVQREKDYQPDEIIYVVDKRQGLHFEQVFRVARKATLVQPKTVFDFIGFGTMNGLDGKPFKTRDGGVMALGDLIDMLRTSVREKLDGADHGYTDEEKNDIAIKVGLAALKFGDLSNHPERDYVFDLHQFASFEGKTGPYIQYALVRMKSILKKCGCPTDGMISGTILSAKSDAEGDIQLHLSRFADTAQQALQEKAPYRLCEYSYELCKLFNRFYHETHIVDHADPVQKESWLALIGLMVRTGSVCMELLGMDVLEKM